MAKKSQTYSMAVADWGSTEHPTILNLPDYPYVYTQYHILYLFSGLTRPHI